MNIKTIRYFLLTLIFLGCELKGQNVQIPKNFEVLYPTLKNSLLKVVCESYKIKEEPSRLEVLSKETDMFLSSWEWDLKNSPIVLKDIDNDGLTDYTIELFNEGGGCGGQIGQQERWTLYGSNPKEFVWTHVVPYRSPTGNWQKIQKNRTYDIDFRDPKSVVNAIFFAAQTRDFAILSCLCDPYGKGDGDTKFICSMPQIAKQDEFALAFESGGITGQVTFEDNEEGQIAKVPIMFFNDERKTSRIDETISLVKRHGNWYLSSF